MGGWVKEQHKLGSLRTVKPQKNREEVKLGNHQPQRVQGAGETQEEPKRKCGFGGRPTRRGSIGWVMLQKIRDSRCGLRKRPTRNRSPGG